MLGDIRQTQNVYIVTGYTDMRKGLRSLVPYVISPAFGIPAPKRVLTFC